MEINPIDKVDDLIDRLIEYQPIIHSKADSGYDWLEEEDVCVKIMNPSSDNHLEILFQNNGESTIFYADNHEHYFGYDVEYKLMCELITDILCNKKCSASLFCGKENKLLGSSYVDKNEINQSVREMFDFVLKYKEFADRLASNGGAVRFTFWDSELNYTIEINNEMET